MKQTLLQVSLILLFAIISIISFYEIISLEEIDKTFLTLSTFLFALFTGFFISRQAVRYSDIRKLTADFDGIMSATYRAFGHYSKEAQVLVGEIISTHYKNTLGGGWDYHLKNKSTTLTDIHNLTDKTVQEVGGDGVKGAISTRIMLGLHDTQKIRKNMVALHDERIPAFQMLLVYMLTTILVVTVFTIPSVGLLLGSLVKSAFIVSVIVVVILLKKLDSLELFAGGIGEKSAKDVVDIINGEK